MAVSIIEALMNGKMNLETLLGSNKTHPIAQMAFSQLHNGITLLEKGYDPEDEVEPLLQQYGDVDKVPEKIKQ